MNTDDDEQSNDDLVSFSNKVLDLKKNCVSLSMNVTGSSHQWVNLDRFQNHDEYVFSLELVSFVDRMLELVYKPYLRKIVILSCCRRTFSFLKDLVAVLDIQFIVDYHVTQSIKSHRYLFNIKNSIRTMCNWLLTCGKCFSKIRSASTSMMNIQWPTTNSKRSQVYQKSNSTIWSIKYRIQTFVIQAIDRFEQRLPFFSVNFGSDYRIICWQFYFNYRTNEQWPDQLKAPDEYLWLISYRTMLALVMLVEMKLFISTRRQ